jgi:molybdopterin-guanine dinucleotide biosynthesis protein B
VWGVRAEEFSFSFPAGDEASWSDNMKIVSIIGYHHSGKTTAVESLILYLRASGYTVSSIKDIHQDGFTMEKPGSNSHRHLTASQSCVFARGRDETYLIFRRQLSLHEMLAHLDTDWVIIEGMKDEPIPKVIAAKTTDDIDSLLSDDTIAITGLYSESHDHYKEIPCINALSDADRLGETVITALKKCP